MLSARLVGERRGRGVGDGSGRALGGGLVLSRTRWVGRDSGLRGLHINKRRAYGGGCWLHFGFERE